MYLRFFLFFTFAGLQFGQVSVNQAGYLIDHDKIAVAVNTSESEFELVDYNNSQSVFNGQLVLRNSNDEATGLTTYTADFTGFNIPGRYIIKTGNYESAPFLISDTTFNHVFERSLKGFYYQRCGTALSQEFAGIYHHNKCHSNDAVLHSSTGTSGFISSAGGWHDAGDFGKYIINSGISVGTLLMAYEVFPEKFYNDDLNIPESGNGIPDILDETRVNLEWMLKMQADSGGVYTKLTAANFAGYIMPEDDKSNRYILEISSAATADLAAVAALASRVFAPLDSSFAAYCLDAAESAWEFLELHPDIVPPGGFKNPSNVYTGEYGDGNDRDERLWAAAELFVSTGNENYLDYFISSYSSAGKFNVPYWGDVKSLAFITYLFNASGENELVTAILEEDFRLLLSEIVSAADESGFYTAMRDEDFNWGSNSAVLNKAMLLILGSEYFQEEKYITYAIHQLDYVLGLNGLDMSFITHVGANYPKNIHHRQSIADGIEEPVPGLIAGGPNQYLSDQVLRENFDSSTPPALCYIDHVESYASNEIAINWNAPLVFVAGYFKGGQMPTGIKTGHYIPIDKFELKQNYPNPSNSSTRINFYLGSEGDLQFNIFDATGQLVWTDNFEKLSPGEHSILWNDEMSFSGSLSSGVYIYQLSINNFTQAKKMIYLK